MSYVTQRDAILAHAKAAALTANPKWTNVAVGAPLVKDSKGCRLHYGGERAPVRMGGERVLNGEMVSHRVLLTAWWAVTNLTDSGMEAIDDEMHAFVHALRTNVRGDSKLGGASTDLLMEYAEPDYVVIGNARYAVVMAAFTTDYTEYPLAP